MKSTAETIAVGIDIAIGRLRKIFLVFVLFMAGHIQCGCAAAKAVLADEAYDAANERCRETHAPRSKGLYDCYARADLTWKVTQTVADGGAR